MEAHFAAAPVVYSTLAAARVCHGLLRAQSDKTRTVKPAHRLRQHVYPGQPRQFAAICAKEHAAMLLKTLVFASALRFAAAQEENAISNMISNPLLCVLAAHT